MVYQGSKNKLQKYIIPILQSYIDDNNISTYVEFFGGGQNVIDKINCERKIYFDINEDLVSLLNYAKSDPEISIAPESCSFSHYSEVRQDKEHKIYSQEYRQLIGYMASFSGRYFDGGYQGDQKGGRNMYNERLKNFKKQAPLLKDIEFNCCDYKDINISDYNNCLIYLDPPYKNTKGYGKNKIDYDYFRYFCKELQKNNIVIISEYNMPDDFKCIWSKERVVNKKSDRTTQEIAVEKIYVQ